MTDLTGTWIAQTPFGRLELQVAKDGGFSFGEHRGTLQVVGDQLSVRFGLGGLRDQTIQGVSLPQDDSWWVPIQESGGVLRFVRHTRADRTTVDFPSGLRLSLPTNWIARPSPGAMSLHPPHVSRPGLPPSAFIEVYETLLPGADSEALLMSMRSMLAERTREEPSDGVELREVAGRRVRILRSSANQHTGERLSVKLWIVVNRDHVLAMAQANHDSEIVIGDSIVESAIRTAHWPRWVRQEGLFGTWGHTERVPSGPLTEVVERRLELHPDGSYRRVRSSLLELPDSSSPEMKPPREVKERTGHWYAREGQLMLSAGLRGYRVRVAELSDSGRDLELDAVTWARLN